MSKSEVRKIKQALLKKSKAERFTSIPAKDFLSTGLTTLNLAATGHPDRGIPKGHYALFVGDSSTGKTWIGMQILAEACSNPEFKDYQIVADMPESGALMNVARMFGKKLGERLTAPNGDVSDPQNHSSTVEEFYDNANAVLDNGPCVLLLDSMDSLTTEGEQEQDEKERKARKGGKEVGGSYGTDKAKENSRKLRVLCNRIKKTKSVLIIISQTRQNIGFTARFVPKTRSGGDALTFYNRLEVWLSLREKVWEKIGNKKVKLGQFTKAKIVKNHLSGWEGDIDIPIFKGVGIDDVGACIDYLVDFGHWTEKAKKIGATEFEVDKKREELVAYIEATERESELREIVTSVWKEIEAKTSLKRKVRYE
jgi:RecA/RadA recombinase